MDVDFDKVYIRYIHHVMTTAVGMEGRGREEGMEGEGSESGNQMEGNVQFHSKVIYALPVYNKMNKKVGMLLQKSTDTRGVGISSMRKSIYLLKTTPSSHTHRFHPLPLATPTSCSPHPLATPIHSTHSPQLSSILLTLHKFKVWMTIVESGWNVWVW